MDSRIRTLARNLVRYSTQLKAGEKILIDLYGLEVDIARALVEEVYAVGGIPFVSIKNHQVLRSLLMGATVEQWQMMARYEAERMKEMDAYIAIRAGENASELSDVPPEKTKIYQEHWNHPVHSEIRVNQTRWCVLRWPTHSMAQLATMSTEAFEDYYFDVCTLDYAKMDRNMDPLKARMERTDKVRIVGPGTDLTFSIKGLPAVKCSGRRNIPDGECYTAPVRDSVNGVLTYNTPSVYQGFTYENIRFEFDNGRIVKATANDTDRINKVLDTDEGARYIGEFSFGFNPYILKPMKDTLFDEKIAGSFHFTPGQAYKIADNGNKSAIHWDLVCIQRPEYGGGEIYLDGELVRKDGRFVVEDLLGLNPENLK
ncbi:MAG TPA: aminopeptidase [Symbiobacteriaceae bacterium]|jgi:aminopeptidase|nr:aminopeptidase [Symbiobacteriaceae bacterium]